MLLMMYTVVDGIKKNPQKNPNQAFVTVKNCA